MQLFWTVKRNIGVQQNVNVFGYLITYIIKIVS